MSTYKAGSTIRILIDDLTQAEFDSVYPYDAVKCEADHKKDNIDFEASFTVDADPVTKTFLLTAKTTPEWIKGDYRLDIRFTRGDEFIYWPQNEYISFKIMESVVDDEA